MDEGQPPKRPTRALGGIDPDVVNRIVVPSFKLPTTTELLRVAYPNDVRDSWRAALETATALARRQVSDSMAEVIAHQTFARVSQLAALQIGLPEIGRIAERIVAPYLANVAQLQVELQQLIKPAALAAATNFAAQFRDLDLPFRRYQKALLDLGWWVPPSVPLHVFVQLGKLAEQRQRVELRRRMVALGGSSFAVRMVNGWMDLEEFRSRRRFILDGLSDLRDERYRVSIPVLLPLVEGITVEAFSPGSRRGPLAALTRSTTALSGLTDDALVETVTVLFSDQDFATTRPTSRTLNRHFILHGRSTGYGTAANAVKVLFVLDQLASTIRHRAARHS